MTFVSVQPSSAVALQTGLRLVCFDSPAQMQAIRADWEALEDRDPEATVFLAWRWLEPVFRANPGRWRVLAAYHDDRLVAVFPMKYRVHWSTSRQELQTEIEAGGRLIGSEYTGFLCDPDWQQPALTGMAAYLQDLPWARLSVRYEDSEARSAQFMAGFPDASYKKRWETYFINKGQTDNLACPRIALPDSYDDYLTASFSKNSRKRIRRYTSRHLDTGDFRLVWSEGARAGEGIEALLGLWMRQWGPLKGAAAAEKTAANYRRILGIANRMGVLKLPVMWQGDRPIGALGHVLDPRRKRLHVIVTGRDIAADEGYLGLLLHTQSIQWAIENGYRIYDFGHGNEDYKYRFGAQDTRVNYFSIRPTGRAAAGARLDPICIAEALRRVTRFIDSGDTERAGVTCRQLYDLIGPKTATDLQA